MTRRSGSISLLIPRNCAWGLSESDTIDYTIHRHNLFRIEIDTYHFESEALLEDYRSYQELNNVWMQQGNLLAAVLGLWQGKRTNGELDHNRLLEKIGKHTGVRKDDCRTMISRGEEEGGDDKAVSPA